MKLKEMKNRIVENKDEIVTYSIVAGGVALYIGLMVVGIKRQNQYNAQVAARRTQLLDAINQGKTILPNTDGSFWILDPTG